MKFENRGYNIPVITIETALTAGSKTEVGTYGDYTRFAAITNESGLFRGKITLGTTPMDGTLICNPWADGSGKISITTLGNMGGTGPVVIQGIIEPDEDNDIVYATVSTFTPAAES